MRACGALAVLAVAAGSAFAATGPDLHEWRYRRPITVPGGPEEYAEITVDGSLYDRAALSFRDVRLTSAQGAVVPHVVQEWPGSTSESTVSTRILNRSVLPGRLTRLELETGAQRAHNRLQLDIEGGPFTRRVTVEGSDDRRTWLVLTSTVISRGAGAAPTLITYPESTYRNVRLTVLDRGEPPLRVTSAAMVLTRTVPAREDVWYNGPVSGITDLAAKSTIVIVDLGHRGVPMSRATLTIERPDTFARDVAVAVSGDRESWTASQEGHLVRERGGGTAAPITLSFGETRGRYLQLTVFNGDNPPLEIRRVAVFGIRRTILFPAAEGTSYWLYVGHPTAPLPDYDLSRVLQLRDVPPRPIPAVAGALEPNPAYAPPVVRRPWTEERPWLLWGTIGGSIMILLLVITQTVRSMRGAG